MKLMIINGSVREGRRTDTIQAWVLDVLKQDQELEIDFVDVRDLNLPFFNEAVIPSANSGTYQNPNGQAWSERVAAAEAFLFISPEYNHAPTAVQKNAIDWVYEGWRYKPVGFVSFGGVAGGTRAVQQLRQVLLNVDAISVNGGVHLRTKEDLDENGRPKSTWDDSLRSVVNNIKALRKRLNP